MMLSQPSFFPLYFDETEADLWLALQRIEPEKRSSFIKESLRQALFNTPVHPDISKETLKEDSDPDPKRSYDDFWEEKPVVMETFSLEALFSEVHVPDSDVEPAGWKDLLHNVIGEEDDEAVIAVLQDSAPAEVREEQSDNLIMKIDQLKQQEFDISSLHVSKPIPTAGYEYMMKHIIGVEDDESVLKLLRGTPKK